MILTPLRLTLLVSAASATLALAHEGATGVVKERMDMMKRQKKDMKLIGNMAKGKTKFDAAKAAAATWRRGGHAGHEAWRAPRPPLNAAAINTTSAANSLST